MKYVKIFLLFLASIIMYSSCKDSSVEPDTQFIQIDFKYNFKDELNTFENYYQKDLVIDGVIKVSFWLTQEEQNNILQKVEETNYFALPDTILNTAPVEVTPNPTQYLKIKYSNEEHAVVWNYIVQEYQTEHYKKLLELANSITRIIESKPEYKKLPPRNGGYD